MRCIVLVVLFSILSVASVTGQDVRVYTRNADFDEGILDGVNHDYVEDQLQLSEDGGFTFSVMWVANTEEGTVSKVDTRTGRELARYRSGPPGYTETYYTTHTVIEKESKRIARIGYRGATPGMPRVINRTCYIDRMATKPFVRQSKRKPVRFRPQRSSKNPAIREVTKEHHKTIQARPSATVVDLDGHAWVANRGDGTVVNPL